MGATQEAQITVADFGVSGLTVNFTVIKLIDDSTFDSGSAPEVGSTGEYKCSWTPNASDFYLVILESSTGSKRASFLYGVDKGQEVTIITNLGTLLTRISDIRAGYLDELDFALQEAIAALQTDLDNPSQYMADLSTLETRLSAIRAGYLDQLDFALQEAIAALQTDLDNPDQYKADVSNLDVAVSTRSSHDDPDPSGYIDVSIASRAPSGEYDTELDVVLSTRAPASEYDTELDVVLSTRAPSSEYDTQLGATERAAASVLEDAMQKATTPAWNQDTDSLEAIRELCDTLATAAALLIIDEFHDVPATDATANAQINEVLGSKGDSVAAAINATNSLMRYMKGALGATWTAESLKAIYDLLDSILDLTETGGTLAATGAEDTIYISDSPSGVWEPRSVSIDLTNMQAADTVQIKVYERIKSGGSYILHAGGPLLLYFDVQAIPDFSYPLNPNRYGIKVTLEQTAGTNRNYDWEVFYSG